ncbi:MAG: hypothetical protein R3348_05225 [Xanthomonadales bacterium]|nr:hypothetical protein [Xanthomonadales bacterium]
MHLFIFDRLTRLRLQMTPTGVKETDVPHCGTWLTPMRLQMTPGGVAPVTRLGEFGADLGEKVLTCTIEALHALSGGFMNNGQFFYYVDIGYSNVTMVLGFQGRGPKSVFHRSAPPWNTWRKSVLPL